MFLLLTQHQQSHSDLSEAVTNQSWEFALVSLCLWLTQIEIPRSAEVAVPGAGRGESESLLRGSQAVTVQQDNPAGHQGYRGMEDILHEAKKYVT